MENQSPMIVDFLNTILLEREAAVAAGVCVTCKQPFTPVNVFTDAGWRETKISHMCEACWDTLFADETD